MVARVGIYTRLSEAVDGEQTATARQEADCRAYINGRGWEVARVYEDVDLSGWKQVHRPGFEEMLDDLDQRRIDGVCAWKLDRLSRNRRDFTRLAETVEKRKAILAAARDPVDTSSEVGWVMVDLLASFARMESANISTRTSAAHAAAARDGKPHPTGQRAFGYERGYGAVRGEEAAAIVDAAQRVLAGESLGSIVREWNARGLRTGADGHWRTNTLGRTLKAPHLAGRRVYRGEVVAEGCWEPILDDATHERLKAVLGDPARWRGGGGPAKYLLSGGLLRCGLCATAMVSRPRYDKVRRYVCRSDESIPGCGRVGIIAQPLEGEVRDRVFHALDTPGLLDALRARHEDVNHRDLVGRLHGDEEALEELARDFYKERVISRPEFLTMRREIEERIIETRRRLARTAGPLDDLPSGGDALRATWEAHSHDVRWQRALLSVLVDRVEIGEAVHGRAFFDPGRVRVVWRG